MSRRSTALLAIVCLATSAQAAPLRVEDFDFSGPLGCSGAKIEALGENHFRVTPGSAPEHPDWNNKVQFTINKARGNALVLEVVYPVAKPYSFNEYYFSWSYDAETWRPLHWEHGPTPPVKKDRLIFPEFTQDRVYVGHQTPMSYEKAVALQEAWSQHPAASLHVFGKSLEGRPLYRLTITEPGGPYPLAQRWRHYFANQHPGEHNAQWRMAGMITWLLSDEAKAMRERSICDFILMSSVDAPSKGWYRVNKEGVDMNRSYFVEGADQEKQAHEAFLLQRDLEALMDSEPPPTTIWSMHTWGGPVECLVLPGPEIGGALPPFASLVQIIESYDDARDLVEPLYEKKLTLSDASHWDTGPHLQFGVTTVLCEGGGGIDTKTDNMDSGVVLIKGLAEYYRGVRPEGG